ncbi:MAG: hypothetical protein ACKPIB_03990 [Dolichospermum sp.]
MKAIAGSKRSLSSSVSGETRKYDPKICLYYLTMSVDVGIFGELFHGLCSTAPTSC